jgi:hypothetical protein
MQHLRCSLSQAAFKPSDKPTPPNGVLLLRAKFGNRTTHFGSREDARRIVSKVERACCPVPVLCPVRAHQHAPATADVAPSLHWHFNPHLVPDAL